MKKIGILFMLLVSLMFVGCVSEADFIKKTTLLTVQRTGNNILESESYEIKTVLDEKNYEKNELEDEFVKMRLYSTDYNMVLELENKTDSTMKFHWNEAVYNDEMGRSQKVTPVSNDYSLRHEYRPPDIIAKNSKISVIIIPVDYIRYERTLSYSGWTYDKLGFGDVSMIIPIETNWSIKEYTLNFNFPKKN